MGKTKLTNLRQPTKTSTKKEARFRHTFSGRLKADPRISAPPRFVTVLNQEENKEFAVAVKIYGPLGTPGAELVTIAIYYTMKETEVEFCMDEKFAVPIQFRKMSDQERADYIASQIKSRGGYRAFVEQR